jgi:hypothetical protein
MERGQFAGAELETAVGAIREYGKDYGLTPDELADVFHEGILAIAKKPNRPAWLARARLARERWEGTAVTKTAE